MERRNFLKGFAAAGSVAVMAPTLSLAEAKKAKKKSEFAMSLQDAKNTITNGKTSTKSEKIKLTVPEIAENGKVVPVKISVKSPMSEQDYIKSIHLLTTKNGNARCANVFLTPANGEAYFSTRIKLSGTQEVVAIAETSSGEFYEASKSVKVTIGGCG